MNSQKNHMWSLLNKGILDDKECVRRYEDAAWEGKGEEGTCIVCVEEGTIMKKRQFLLVFEEKGMKSNVIYYKIDFLKKRSIFFLIWFMYAKKYPGNSHLAKILQKL